MHRANKSCHWVVMSSVKNHSLSGIIITPREGYENPLLARSVSEGAADSSKKPRRSSKRSSISRNYEREYSISSISPNVSPHAPAGSSKTFCSRLLSSVKRILFIALLWLIDIGISFASFLGCHKLKKRIEAKRVDAEARKSDIVVQVAAEQYLNKLKQKTKEFEDPKAVNVVSTYVQEAIDDYKASRRGSVTFDADLNRVGSIITLYENGQSKETIITGSGVADIADQTIRSIVGQDDKWLPVIRSFCTQTMGNGCDYPLKMSAEDAYQDVADLLSSVHNNATLKMELAVEYDIRIDITRDNQGVIREVQVKRSGKYHPVLSGAGDQGPALIRGGQTEVNSMIVFKAYLDGNEIKTSEGQTSHVWADNSTDLDDE